MKTLTWLTIVLALNAALIAACVRAEQSFNPHAGPTSPRGAAAAAPAPASSAAATEEMIIVVGGIPISGTRVLPANDKTFRIKLSETGQVVELSWKDLEASERCRVKRYYGLDESDGRTVWGEKVRAVRLELASGKQFVAMPLPERDGYGQRAFKTAGAPLMLISANTIQSEERVDGWESDFFTPGEVYQRWLLEKPPSHTDAAAYIDLAHRCATIGLFHEALDNLKCAELIDPRTHDIQRDFRMMVIADDARRAALDLFQKLLRAKGADNWLEAEEILLKLDRNFPNSEFKSRWDGLRATVEAGVRMELKRSAVPLSYITMLNLLRKEVCRTFKIDAKGNLIPAFPGKQVTTTHGDIFRGTPVKADYTGYISLKVGDMELSIAEKDIMSIRDIDLDHGDTADIRRPTYDQVLEYVSDLKKRTCLKGEMISVIADRMNMPDEKVREIFDTRGGRKAHYEDGKMTVEQGYVSIQDASYGKGSWLRTGTKMKPLIIEGKAPEQIHKDKDQEAENSDDPNVWWAHQNAETQIEILRAIAAEKVFRVKNVLEEPCDQCQGSGSMVVNTADTHTVYRCPKCRGLTVIYKIRYE
jgi:hypothetical protein